MIVKAACRAAPGRDENEDAFCVATDFVGVVDGATVPDGVETGCIHSAGWYATNLASHLLAAHRGLPGDSLPVVLAVAIEAVREDHHLTCDLAHPGTHSAAVGVLRVVHNQLDYLILGDVTIVFDQADAVSAITDARFGQAVADIRRRAFAGAPALDTSAQVDRVREAAHMRQALTNKPDGYWIAAADPSAAEHAITGQIRATDAEPLTRVALLTDGAADAVDRYGLLGWSALLDLISESGPEALIDEVRQAELADGDGHSQPRYKRHDDATVVLCTFTEERS